MTRAFDGPRIEVIGADELRRQLRRAGNKADGRGLRQAHKSAAQEVADRALPKTPRRSGRLARSVKAVASQSSAKVKAGTASRVPYAPPIHWGWPARNITPSMFLWDARNEALNDGSVETIYRRELDDLLGHHIKGTRRVR